MALGDGVRRNLRTVTPHERERFKQALLALLGRKAAGIRAEVPPMGLSAWFEQDELYQAMSVHYGPEFLPWHREQCNRFEQLLRQIDPDLSLHYWDWNDDPQDLFGPAPGHPASRDLRVACTPDGRDRSLLRQTDAAILGAETFEAMRGLLERKRAEAYAAYAGATISKAHMSFRDPFMFPLHANVDRMFAMWQAQGGQAWRLDPELVYGPEGPLLRTMTVEPWPADLTVRPWSLVDPSARPRSYVHPAIVTPPCYDSLPTRVVVDEGANPGGSIAFHDVQPGQRFARAASFQIFGGGNLTFAVTQGPTGPYSVITPGGVIRVAHAAGLYQEARIWFAYRGEAPNTAAAPGEVTIRCKETNQDFQFTLSANTLAEPAGVAARTRDEPNPPDSVHCSHWADVTWTWTWRPAGG
jgi:hypothetical protein